MARHSLTTEWQHLFGTRQVSVLRRCLLCGCAEVVHIKPICVPHSGIAEDLSSGEVKPFCWVIFRLFEGSWYLRLHGEAVKAKQSKKTCSFRR